MLRGFRNFTLFFFSLSAHAFYERPSSCEDRFGDTVLIVDGYSSGSLLAPELLAQRYNVIHVHSQGAPLDFQRGSFHAKNFRADYPYRGDREGLEAWVRAWRPRAILAGSEAGVLLADELSARFHDELGTPSNGVEIARRDKYFMAEKLRAAGVPAVMQMKTRDVEEAKRWVRAKNLWPGKVVVKPLMSAGTMGVNICHSEAEVDQAFAELLGFDNGYGLINNEILVQEFLEGEEYVVNTVSSDGITVVTDMWHYHKKKNDIGKWIYDHDRLIPYKGALGRELVPYVLRVIEALGVRTGWGHAEIKMTPRGPVLIEIGARMMGSLQPRLAKDALGTNQVELGIEAFLRPAKFFRYGLGYEMTKGAALVTLNNPYPWARLRGSQMDARIRGLPGYRRHHFSAADETLVSKTNDLHGAIGQVELVHEDPAVLDASIAQLQAWDREGLFLERAEAPVEARH